MSVSQCPLCNHPNAPTASVCDACGVGLVALCPACGTVNEVSASHCGDCDAVLPASDAQRIGNALRQAGRPAAAIDQGPFNAAAFTAHPAPDHAVSRAFLVRFGNDGSVAVQPVPTLGAVAQPRRQRLPVLTQPLRAVRTVHWRGAAVAAALLGAVGFGAWLGGSPRIADRASEVAAPATPPVDARSAALAALPSALPPPLASAPRPPIDRALAELQQAPPAAGPATATRTARVVAAKPRPAPAKAAAVAPRALAKAVVVPARPSGTTASSESAAAVSAALARQRVADNNPPRPAPRSAPCDLTVAALGLCTPAPPRSP